MTSRRFLALALPAILLAGCSSGSGVPMPGPDPTASPSANAPGVVDGPGWRVQAQNDYVDASGPVCSDEDILTNPDSEFPGVYLEQGPGMPDDWKPGDPYQVNSDGILLEFDTGKYSAGRFDGDVSTGIGSVWETFGTFTFERDAQGVITGGSGSGPTRYISVDGDTERSTDTMTFTVTVTPDPPWCALLLDGL